MSGVWCLGGQFEHGIGGVASTALGVGVWLAVGLLGRVGNGRLPARGRAGMKCMASFVWITNPCLERFNYGLCIKVYIDLRLLVQLG